MLSRSPTSPALESEAPEVVEARIGLSPPRPLDTLVSPMFSEPAEKIPSSPKFSSLPIPVRSPQKDGLPKVPATSLRGRLYGSSHRLDRCVKIEGKEKTILGFRSWIFWTVVGTLLVVLAVGGLVWGIVGMYNMRRKNDSATSEALSPSSTATTLPTTCPQINGTEYTSLVSPLYTFLILCATNIQAQANDLASMYSPSLASCIDSCAGHNANATGKSNAECKSITWTQYDPRNSTLNQLCFLKGSEGKTTTVDNGLICQSAILIS